MLVNVKLTAEANYDNWLVHPVAHMVTRHYSEIKPRESRSDLCSFPISTPTLLERWGRAEI